jgi:hypothetical protein
MEIMEIEEIMLMELSARPCGKMDVFISGLRIHGIFTPEEIQAELEFLAMEGLLHVSRQGFYVYRPYFSNRARRLR